MKKYGSSPKNQLLLFDIKIENWIILFILQIKKSRLPFDMRPLIQFE